MLTRFFRSSPFLLLRIFLVGVIGFFFALFKLLILFVLFAYVLAPLATTTYVGLQLQQQYPMLIDEFFEDPQLEDTVIETVNTGITAYNLVIQISAFVVEIWDYFVPGIYLVGNILEQVAEEVLTTIFGTPKLQCIIADLLKVGAEVLDHGLIDINRIFHTVTQFMQSEEVQELLRSTNGCDPNNPEQVDGCPAQGTILQLFVIVLKLSMDLSTIIIQFLTPFVISFFQTVVTQVIQWVPAVTKILSALFSALLNDGIIGDLVDTLKSLFKDIKPLYNLFCPVFAATASATCEAIVVIDTAIDDIIRSIEDAICALDPSNWFSEERDTSNIQEAENIVVQLTKLYGPELRQLNATERVRNFEELLVNQLDLTTEDVFQVSIDLADSAKNLTLVSSEYDEFIAQTAFSLAERSGDMPIVAFEELIQSVISRATFVSAVDKVAHLQTGEILAQIGLFENTEQADSFMSINNRAITLTSVDQLLKDLQNIPNTTGEGLLGKPSFCKKKNKVKTNFDADSKACKRLLKDTCPKTDFSRDLKKLAKDIVNSEKDISKVNEDILEVVPEAIGDIGLLLENSVQDFEVLITDIVKDTVGAVEFIVNVGLLNNSIQELVDDLNFDAYDSATKSNSNPTKSGFNLNPYTCCSFPSLNSSSCCDGQPGFPPANNGGKNDLCTLRSDKDATASGPIDSFSRQIFETTTLLDDNDMTVRAATTTIQRKQIVNEAFVKTQRLMDTLTYFYDTSDRFFATPDALGENDDCEATPDDPYKCCTANSTAYQCCRGLFGCIPPVPVNRLTVNFTLTNQTFQWLRELKNPETCSDFSNGIKEVLFLIRLVTNEPINDLIAQVPDFLKPLYEFLFGWLTFGKDGFPQFAIACFILNIGGLLLLILIFVLVGLIILAYGAWFNKLIALAEDYNLQREIERNQSDFATNFAGSQMEIHQD